MSKCIAFNSFQQRFSIIANQFRFEAICLSFECVAAEICQIADIVPSAIK